MKGKAATWRSLLYVPGNNERFIAKAQSRGADAIILDLEDSVPSDRKEDAVKLVSEWLPSLAAGPSDICIRVNGDLLQLARDLRLLGRQGVSAILLPKCDDAGKVRLVAEALDLLDPAGHVGIVPLLESPEGLNNAHAIAAACDRVCALLLGSEDFAAICGITPSEATLLGAKQQIVYAARAAGIAPLGLLDSIAAYAGHDIGALAARSSAFGFSGATAVHPDAIAPLNRGFAPSDEDIEWAKSVVIAMEDAAHRGLGAVSLGGKMIDKPIADRARSTLARQDAFRGKR
ncbi:HpcH/HpaI aldolase/citrate lyase family protein [Roseivivax sediminis]|uniref:Citrate lyase subunit beta / citryl-CoA lyase n=1 Tax=Roseivivax sediminis TaxID=936889 RepID=A0A1I1WBF5_9RHOB|nr:CoA ester lyase [Roseivivax sediminis]SFD92351.1 citrate lyase subunit beta / citryl-CoA lyase [Roseivivax sediminis]